MQKPLLRGDLTLEHPHPTPIKSGGTLSQTTHGVLANVQFTVGPSTGLQIHLVRYATEIAVLGSWHNYRVRSSVCGMGPVAVGEAKRQSEMTLPSPATPPAQTANETRHCIPGRW